MNESRWDNRDESTGNDYHSSTLRARTTKSLYCRSGMFFRRGEHDSPPSHPTPPRSRSFRRSTFHIPHPNLNRIGRSIPNRATDTQEARGID